MVYDSELNRRGLSGSMTTSTSGSKVSQIANIFQNNLIRSAVELETPSSKMQLKKDGSTESNLTGGQHSNKFSSARALFEKLGSSTAEESSFLSTSVNRSANNSHIVHRSTPLKVENQQQHSTSVKPADISPTTRIIDPPKDLNMDSSLNHPRKDAVPETVSVKAVINRYQASTNGVGKPPVADKPDAAKAKVSGRELIEKQKNWVSHFTKKSPTSPEKSPRNRLSKSPDAETPTGRLISPQKPISNPQIQIQTVRIPPKDGNNTHIFQSQQPQHINNKAFKENEPPKNGSFAQEQPDVTKDSFRKQDSTDNSANNGHDKEGLPPIPPAHANNGVHTNLKDTAATHALFTSLSKEPNSPWHESMLKKLEEVNTENIHANGSSTVTTKIPDLLDKHTTSNGTNVTTPSPPIGSNGSSNNRNAIAPAISVESLEDPSSPNKMESRSVLSSSSSSPSASAKSYDRAEDEISMSEEDRTTYSSSQVTVVEPNARDSSSADSAFRYDIEDDDEECKGSEEIEVVKEVICQPASFSSQETLLDVEADEV